MTLKNTLAKPPLTLNAKSVAPNGKSTLHVLIGEDMADLQPVIEGLIKLAGCGHIVTLPNGDVYNRIDTPVFGEYNHELERRDFIWSSDGMKVKHERNIIGHDSNGRKVARRHLKMVWKSL